MNKIIFLIKNNASLKVIMIFLKHKFLNIFCKKKIKHFKKENQIFLKQKKISNDYFSMHAYNFYKRLNGFKDNLNY